MNCASYAELIIMNNIIILDHFFFMVKLGSLHCSDDQ